MQPTSRRSFFKAASLTAGGFLFSESATNAADGPSRLRVVSYNVHNYRLEPYLDPLSEKISPVKPVPERDIMAGILARLKPDLLGLTELGDARALEDLQKRLADSGWEMPHLDILNAADPARHIGILSRFPITTRNHIARPRFVMDEEKYVMSRGIFDVTIDLGSFPLRVVGAHLKSQREVAEAEQSEIRRNEAHLLRVHLEEILQADPLAPILLFGDFNDSKDTPGMHEIMAPEDDLRMTPVDVEDPQNCRWTYHYQPADEYSRIDFIMLSPGLLSTLDEGESGIYTGKDWQQASDHRPIYVTLRPPKAAKFAKETAEQLGKKEKAK